MNEIICELLDFPKSSSITLIADLSMNRKENAAKLNHLMSEIHHLIIEDIDDDERDILLTRLELVLKNLEGTIHRGSVAIYAAHDFAKVVPLNYHAHSRLVSARRFALTELIYSINKYPLYHTIVFGAAGVRVFIGEGEHCTEITDNQAALHLTHLLKSFAHAGQVNAVKDNGRGVRTNLDPRLNDAIVAIYKNLPGTLVIVGTSPAGDVSGTLSNRILATIDGNYEHASVHDISKAVQNACTAAEAEQMQKHAIEIEQLLHEKRLGMGKSEISQLIEEGRVQTIYMEEAAATSLPAENSHHLSETDQLIQTVYKYKGNIVFLTEGMLASYGGVVAGLRY